MKRVGILACLVFAAWSSVSAQSTDAACAPNCYVATTGNDLTGNGTIGSPWATPVKCFNEVHAGGTCWFRGGTYESPDTSSTTLTLPAWGWVFGTATRPEYSVTRTSNGGTAGNPVTMRGHPGETAIFAQESGNFCANLLQVESNVDYVTWLDLTFRSGRSNYAEGSSNITYERCIFKGEPNSPFGGGENPVMLLSGANTVYSCINWVIRNNLFINDSADDASHTSCITGGHGQGFTDLYSWSNGLVENNDFIITANSGNTSNFAVLLGFKNDNQTTTVRNNYLADLTASIGGLRAIWIGGSSGGSPGLQMVYNNITSGAEKGILNEQSQVHDNFFYNNTFYNARGGCWVTLADAGSQTVVENNFFNNICVTGSSTSDLYMDFGWWSEGESDSVNKQDFLDYNIYWKIGSGARRWKDGFPNVYTSDSGGIGAWQTYLDNEGVPSFETNSRLTDPGLTNPGAGDFSLAVGAAARTGGRGGSYPTYLGADNPNSSSDVIGCTFDPRCHGFGGTPSNCGNGTIESPEVCDGAAMGTGTCASLGYQPGGTLACTGTCTYNTANCCGDNVKGSSETCDGTDLASQTCVTQGFSSGTLACASNCASFNTSGCVISTPVTGVLRGVAASGVQKK